MRLFEVVCSIAALFGPIAKVVRLQLFALLSLLATFSATVEANAQLYTNTVPFGDGFIGVYDKGVNSAHSLKLFGNHHVIRATFSQISAFPEFIIDGTQGNDVGGTLTLQMDDGSAVQVPGAIIWRDPGGSVQGVGFIPSPDSTTTVTTTTGANFVVQGAQAGVYKDIASNIGLHFIAATNTSLSFVEGGTASGNSAGTLDGLNAHYLDTVLIERPVGPVTVNSQTTNDTTPVVTGTVTLSAADNETLRVVINGVVYSGSDVVLNLDANGTGTWSVQIPGTSPLGYTTYSVGAMIYDDIGFALEDSTESELTIVNVDASMEVTKEADATTLDYPDVGDTITWTVTASNTGSVTLDNVTVVETLTGGQTAHPTATRSGLGLGDTSFDAGDTWQWQVSYQITQADIDNGGVENYVAITGTAPGGIDFTTYSGADATASSATSAPPSGSRSAVTLVAPPQVTVTKSAATTSLVAPVADVTELSWTVALENTDSRVLSVSGITDTMVQGTASGTATSLTATRTGDTSDTSFDPGDIWTWSVSRVLTQADTDAGSVANTAYATVAVPGSPTQDVHAAADGVAGNARSGDPDPSNWVVTSFTAASPSITVTKTADATTVLATADVTTLSWTISAENTGNVTLGSVRVDGTLTSAAFPTLTATRTGDTSDTSLTPATPGPGR